MRIAIIEDTDIDIKILKHHITSYFPEYINYEILAYSDSEMFFLQFQPDSFQLIFLDIYMPDISGIEVAKRIRAIDNTVKIIFCSSSNSFANESYAVNASYYLAKPFTVAQFMQMLEQILPKPDDASMCICFPNGQQIYPHNIVYTTYFNHRITVYLSNNSTMEVWLKQSELETLLSDFPYLCVCNRGTIVNMHYVEQYTPGNLRLYNGHEISVSRGQEKFVQAAYKSMT